MIGENFYEVLTGYLDDAESLTTSMEHCQSNNMFVTTLGYSKFKLPRSLI